MSKEKAVSKMKEIKEQCRQNGLELDFERVRRPKEYIGTYVLFEVALEYLSKKRMART